MNFIFCSISCSFFCNSEYIYFRPSLLFNLWLLTFLSHFHFGCLSNSFSAIFQLTNCVFSRIFHTLILHALVLTFPFITNYHILLIFQYTNIHVLYKLYYCRGLSCSHQSFVVQTGIYDIYKTSEVKSDDWWVVLPWQILDLSVSTTIILTA